MGIARLSRVQSLPLRFVGRSTRARACCTRPRRRRIDRPALQPHRCHAGEYVYEYNVSLSGTPPTHTGIVVWRSSPRKTARDTACTGRIPNRQHASPPPDTYTNLFHLHPYSPYREEDFRTHFRCTSPLFAGDNSRRYARTTNAHAVANL